MAALMAQSSGPLKDGCLVDQAVVRKEVQMVDALELFEATALAVWMAPSLAASTVEMMVESMVARSEIEMVEYSGWRQVGKTDFGKAVWKARTMD